jgi:hypothetical protein
MESKLQQLEHEPAQTFSYPALDIWSTGLRRGHFGGSGATVRLNSYVGVKINIRGIDVSISPHSEHP